MTPCHVSHAMCSSIITCASFGTSSSHFHLHGICCSHTCTCGLITYVSLINIISPPKVVIQLPSPAAVCGHHGGGLGCPHQVPGCVIFRRSCLAWVHRGHQATRSMDAAVQALCCANCACTVFSELYHCSN
jgi:hypothetical protein